VFAVSPVRLAVTETGVVPDTTDCEVVAVDVANVLLVPHSKKAVVDKPFGFTLPFNVAEVEPTLVAALVVTVGVDTAAVVVKLQVVEYALVPPAFFALTRQ